MKIVSIIFNHRNYTLIVLRQATIVYFSTSRCMFLSIPFYHVISFDMYKEGYPIVFNSPFHGENPLKMEGYDGWPSPTEGSIED